MHRSRWALCLVALAAGAALVTIGAGSVTAQSQGNTFTVEKVVDGTAPPGTEFKVHVVCDEEETDMTFDAQGNPQPSGSNVVDGIGASTTCTATETADGGAKSTTYACDMEFGASDPSHILGQCTDDNEAHFGDVVTDAATITVTNHYDPEPTTTTTTTTTTLPPAEDVVEVQPSFTG